MQLKLKQISRAAASTAFDLKAAASQRGYNLRQHTYARVCGSWQLATGNCHSARPIGCKVVARTKNRKLIAAPKVSLLHLRPPFGGPPIMSLDKVQMGSHKLPPGRP